MNIVQEFVERNELLLGKVAEDNPSLGSALIEALAVINYYATTNNVSFDDAQKEQVLASEELTIAEPVAVKEEEIKPILKQIDEAIAESHQMTPTETKWVMRSPDERAIKQLLKSAELFNIKGYVVQGEGVNANYFLVLDEEYDVLARSQDQTIEDARNTQTQMTQEELDQALKDEQPMQVTPEVAPAETHTPETPIVHASKEFVEDDIIVSAEDLEALKQLEDLEDLGDINLDDLDI